MVLIAIIGKMKACLAFKAFLKSKNKSFGTMARAIQLANDHESVFLFEGMHLCFKVCYNKLPADLRTLNDFTMSITSKRSIW